MKMASTNHQTRKSETMNILNDQWLCEECSEEEQMTYDDWTGVDELYDETAEEQMVCDGCHQGELDLQCFNRPTKD